MALHLCEITARNILGEVLCRFVTSRRDRHLVISEITFPYCAFWTGIFLSETFQSYENKEFSCALLNKRFKIASDWMMLCLLQRENIKCDKNMRFEYISDEMKPWDGNKTDEYICKAILSYNCFSRKGFVDNIRRSLCTAQEKHGDFLKVNLWRFF